MYVQKPMARQLFLGPGGKFSDCEI